MGLLDNLYFGHANPNFGGPGGGLLDFLRTTQMQQENYKPSAGFPDAQPSPLDTAQWPHGPIGAPSQAMAQTQANPISVGDYQMPRMGSADLFQPQQVNIPQNAQLAQGQMPGQAPQSSLFGAGSVLGRIGNPDGLIARLTGNDSRSVAQNQANQTSQYLVSKGFDPALARTVVSDPTLLRAVLPQMMGMGGQTDDIKEYQFAKKEDPSLTFAKFMQQKKAVSGEYSLTPQYGTNDKGETVLIQTGKSGEAIQTKLPSGVKVSSGVDKVDLGTQWGIIDKRTGNMVGTQPKDVAGKEAAEKVGQARGVAQAALAGGADIDAEQTKKKIDEFIKNKGFNEVFGQLDQYRPKWLHSNEGADAIARYEQLTGVAFLSAYQMLKGGGAITDIEGQKAGAAMARLNRAQSEVEAKRALEDFKEAVDIGLQKLKRAAAGGEAPQSTAPAPKRIRLNPDGTVAQ